MSRRAVREKIKNRATIAERAQKEAAHTEILRTETVGCIEVDEGETTADVTQEQIKRHVSIKTAEQSFKLSMDNGPIRAKHSRNGVHMLLHNEKGYLSSFNVKTMNLHFEIDIGEKIHDATYLHNEGFVAVAQKNNVFVYNGEGAEVHCVRKNSNVFKMEYLPYHYLLATASSSSFLRYQDVSTGEIVSEVWMKDKNITSMKQNPRNAVIHTGSAKGVVSLWSPNSKEYLMKVLCHKNTVSNVEIDRSGTYMVTTGLDSKVNVWDLRNTYTQMNSLSAGFNVQTASLSQKNMLAMSCGDKIRIWKDFFSSKDDALYLKHRTAGRHVASLDFCSYEDILSIGHAGGVSNIIVPGCGDPVYDSYEDSPFMSKGMKREKEVRRLLEKIPYELISIESKVGSIYRPQKTDAPSRKPERYFDAESVEKGALSRFYNRNAC